jgi:HSP20 family protein
MGDIMVEKEIKETKKTAGKKAGDLKKTAVKTKEQAEDTVGGFKETAVDKKETAEEAAVSGRKQAEKIINDFINSISSRQEDFSKTVKDYTTAMDKPLADVVETDDEIIVKTDLPGVKKNDIDVSLTEDSVEITAQFNEEFSEQDVNYIRRERNYGKTHKMMKLPAKVKVKDAKAKFENSILTINLPKLEKSKFKVDIL